MKTESLRFDWFIADNAECPHTGVIDVVTDKVLASFPLDADPDGSKAEQLCVEKNAA